MIRAGTDSVPTHVDTLTGQVLGLKPLVSRPERQRIPFIMVYRDVSLDAFVDDATVTVSELRVFFHLLRSAPFGECYQLNQSRVGERLGLHAGTVNRALKGLVERGVVLKDSERRDCYRINPDIAYTDGSPKRKKNAQLADA